MLRLARLPLLALIPAALAAAPLAAQSVTGFQLPPGPTPSPSSAPQPQGPVDNSGYVPKGPRTIGDEAPTPSPSPSPMPSPSSSASPAPAPAPPPSARPAPAPSRSPPQAVPSQAPAATPTPDVPTPVPQLEPAPATTSPELPAAPESIAPPREAESAGGGMLPWYAGGGAALVLAALGGFLWWRRRSGARATGNVPQIELPLTEALDDDAPVAPTAPAAIPEPSFATPRASIPATPSAPPLPRTGAANAPLVEIETVVLTRTFANIRVDYRIKLTNRAPGTLEGLEIEGDLVAAHGAAGIDRQLADPAAPLPPCGRIESIPPGAHASLSGTLTLALAEIQPIRQGNVPLLVPLLRWRGHGGGIAPFARTFLLGRLPEVIGTRLLPIRLDEPPQSYRDLGLKPLD